MCINSEFNVAAAPVSDFKIYSLFFFFDIHLPDIRKYGRLGFSNVVFNKFSAFQIEICPSTSDESMQKLVSVDKIIYLIYKCVLLCIGCNRLRSPHRLAGCCARGLRVTTAAPAAALRESREAPTLKTKRYL